MAAITPIILATVILICKANVITNIPRSRTSGLPLLLMPNVLPYESHESPETPAVTSDISPPITMPIIINKSKSHPFVLRNTTHVTPFPLKSI